MESNFSHNFRIRNSVKRRRRSRGRRSWRWCGVGEEDLGAVRVIPGTFLGVGEDFVSMLEFLELHSDFFLGETRFHELVWVALVKKKCKPFQGTSQTLTRDIQRQRLMVNVQLTRPGSTLHKFIKRWTEFVN